MTYPNVDVVQIESNEWTVGLPGVRRECDLVVIEKCYPGAYFSVTYDGTPPKIFNTLEEALVLAGFLMGIAHANEPGEQ